MKQDFLVYDASARGVTYYSGQGARGDKLHGTIDEFCERFGEPHFGCTRTSTSTWDCKDHHYAIEDERLPIEPDFRAAVKDAIRRAREDLQGAQA
jgi:hypothetical protein